MKQKLIILISFILLSGLSFGQNDRFYQYVSFNVLNSENTIIENARVVVDGKEIPFDSIRRSYYLVDTFNFYFNMTVSCEGYDTLNYSRQNLQNFNTGFFRANLWLKRPAEKFYYASDFWLKIPYKPHPDKLLVILDFRKLQQDDSLWTRFENEIKQHGLKINHTFIETPSDPIEQWKFNSYVGLEYRLIIEKENGGNFDEEYCRELGYLRQLEMVYGAGPLVNLGDKYNLVTYDNMIHLPYQLMHYKSEEINRIVKQVDERFYYDEKTNCIILPAETNEIVPRIMEKLKDAGFKEKMNMTLFFMTVLD